MSKQIQPPIDGGVLEGISRVLGDTSNGLTGTEIGKILQEVNIPDIDSTNTKWKRLYNAFVTFQNRKQLSNNILTFINKSMNPARFIGQNEQYEDTRVELNKRLSFMGLELTDKGQLKRTIQSQTITEAEHKADRLKSKLEQRNTHPTIFKYCKAELLAENYFHTIFEATKSIADTIRNRTGLTEDGSELIDKAFSIKNPLITINDLSSETKESEHKGFANLIKGIFGMFRNTTAHSPKIIWEINEQDALDILSTISLIHRRIGISE
jgi:uncharacterized protein (TIGR02391 family)